MRYAVTATAFAALALSLTSTVVGQTQTLNFEIVSVKPSNPDALARTGFSCTGGPVQLDPTHFAATNKNLYSLIALSYGINCGVMMTQDILFGGPSWITSDQFDIAAVIPQGIQQEPHDPGVLPRPIQAMLQKLMADRFKLAVHRETRTVSTFVLVTGKSRVKLQKAPENRDCAVEAGCGLSGGPATGLKGKSADMSQLAQTLALLIGRSVVDRTGIEGKFDIQIPPWSSIGSIDNGKEPVADPNGPSIFGVLQDIGLRLETRKIPLQVLIIDHAEKPDAN